MSKITEYQMVAALLIMDIKVMAIAYPDNEPLQNLYKKSLEVIEDKEIRESRYMAGVQVFSAGRAANKE